jgi:hypothetical protein
MTTCRFCKGAPCAGIHSQHPKVILAEPFFAYPPGISGAPRVLFCGNSGDHGVGFYGGEVVDHDGIRVGWMFPEGCCHDQKTSSPICENIIQPVAHPTVLGYILAMRIKHTPTPASWVRFAIGSMAIEGIRTSPEQQEEMLAVAEGRIDGNALIRQRADEYRRQNQARRTAR